MVRLKLVLLSFVLCVGQCNPNERFLICKSVSSLFDFYTPNNLDNVPSGLTTGVSEEGNVSPSQTIQQQLKYIKDQMKCLDGVVAGGKCFRLLYRVGVKVSFLQAENLCNFHGGIVAEIATEEIYNKVFQYVRKYWSVDLEAKGRNFVQVFLNSEYENSRVLLRNGQEAYINWHPRYPTTNPNHRRMLISITINNHHPASENGMFNYNVEYTAMPLCEFDLD